MQEKLKRAFLSDGRLLPRNDNTAHRGRPLNLLYETRSERSFLEYHRKHGLTSRKLAEYKKYF